VIGVLVPAHDEEVLVGDCLRSILAAARSPALGGEAVEVVVALDRCTDATADICAALGVRTVAIDARCVGRARAAAAEVLLRAGARWLASTDADSQVPLDWLSGQLACRADAFCGTVRVSDWLDFATCVRAAFHAAEHYFDGHPHVHGANLGVSADAYRAVGGFAALAAHEDRALLQALDRGGFTVARRATPAVVTSARRDARARHGFGDYLLGLEAGAA
jgi:glycosyltransferase involved in cell wall biosynthesis